MRNRQGFTLIELVIVILIIGILAVVLIPQFNSMVNKSKTAGVLQDFREFQTAAQAVAYEDGGFNKDTLIDRLNQNLDAENQIQSNNKSKNKDPWGSNYTMKFIPATYRAGNTVKFICNGSDKDIETLSDNMETVVEYTSDGSIMIHNFGPGEISDGLKLPSESIPIDHPYFSDDMFITFLRGEAGYPYNGFQNDADDDNRFTQAEIDTIKSINLKQYGTTELQGIEYFRKLESLNIDRTNVKKLDLSYNKKLKYLYAPFNNLEGVLDLSENVNLIDLDLNNEWAHSKLEEVILGEKPNLQHINLSWSPVISMDLTGCSALISINAWNSSLKAMDVSTNPTLEEIRLDGSQVEDFKAKNNPKLQFLNMAKVPIKSIDISGATGITELSIPDSRGLKALSVVNNTLIRKLNVNSTGISELDLSKNTELEDLNIGNCAALTNLNLTNNKKLRVLFANNSGLKTLNVSGINPEEIRCSFTDIEDLDLTGMTNLRILDLRETNISEIDLTKTPNLRSLDVRGTKITRIDVPEGMNIAIYANADGSVTIPGYRPRTSNDPWVKE